MTINTHWQSVGIRLERINTSDVLMKTCLRFKEMLITCLPSLLPSLIALKGYYVH